MIDRKAFFAAIRASLFNGRMRQPQVDGINAILDEYERRNLTDVRVLAHILATVFRETGARFQPITESLDYTAAALKRLYPNRISAADADKYGRTPAHAANQEMIGNLIYGGEFGLKQLGNTERGDGYKYRGRGLPQITGRGNYAKFSPLVGKDLIGSPDLALDLPTSVRVLFEGLYQGLFTGKKLTDYFPKVGQADWVNARRALNGLDHAEEIAENAIKFNAALQGSIVVGSPPSMVTVNPAPNASQPRVPSPGMSGSVGYQDPPFTLPPDVEPSKPIPRPVPKPDPGLTTEQLNDLASKTGCNFFTKFRRSR